MPEIKKEANVDSVKMLGEYKATKLVELTENISRQKSRAAVIMASIKAKRDELAQKAAEIEKAKEEARANEKAVFDEKEKEIEKEIQNKSEEKPVAEVAKDAEAKVEKEEKPTPAVSEEKKPQPAPAPQKEEKKEEKKAEPVAPKAEEKKQDVTKKPHVTVVPKTPFELAQENPEILPNGEVRRIYVPPTPKPKVQTRVFGQGGYQQPRGPKPQQNQGGYQGKTAQLTAVAFAAR